MSRTLAKPWNRAAPGTVITTDRKEAEETGATLVDPARFAHLDAEGFFEPDVEPEAQDAPKSPLPDDLAFKGTDKAIPLGEIPRESAPPPIPSTRKAATKEGRS